MNRIIGRVVSVLSGVALIGVLGAGTASAGTDTGWVPDGPNDPTSISACGTTLTITDVVNKVEHRTLTDNRANEITDYRGAYVVRVAAPDGRKAVLDNSGPYRRITSANGAVFYDITTPAFVYAFDAVEVAAFKKAGLPSAFYFTSGRLDLFISAAGDEKVLVKPRNAVSICSLLRRP